MHDLKGQLAAAAAAGEAAKAQISKMQSEQAAMLRARSSKTQNPSVEGELQELRCAFQCTCAAVCCDPSHHILGSLIRVALVMAANIGQIGAQLSTAQHGAAQAAAAAVLTACDASSA